ncbi:hypothetical protein V495_05676 [Pseudogymnoascus sp. VKM F-4514 (FW-929)]|nr:hypothetical protein V490_07321 [Pseudogymnoascus sp. VKM F-3557]KFY39952.1 hypothetical protein V495_05676 [Pseudogymnoascus sp. VKM F-4514 (FW-929)]KFY58190.1 hypothetical protein V497_04985 [Pseudogymnoascus sp. VKM F-4516 (FW-969)]
MAETRAKAGHFVAKALGIKLDPPNAYEATTRGESVFSTKTADTFVEEEPTTWEWISETVPSWKDTGAYFRSLFPFTYWITRYNLQWLIGDLVAGITIGAVVVPQGMAYAQLAKLDVQFGLYSSFMGVLVYWFFATSKDITIGPVAVMSTIVGNVVLKAKGIDDSIPGHVIASALAVICGAIIVTIGLLRMGWIVDLISLTSITAFMTGSAISIAAGQVPTMMGINKRLDTRGPTYLVIINTLKQLKHSNLNAAMGVSALAMLYIIRFACSYAAKKYPSQKKTFFFVSTLRTVFVILLYTLISYLVNRHHRDPKQWRFAILGPVPRGFQNAAVPTITIPIIKLFISEVPASVIVLLIEHIAISKSFGRINNYIIDPSQEMVAIGVTNILGPFLGGYPATGSFSRTAIKSKAGVRTPFAGVITAAVVLLAIYALPAVFYYIPNASLSGVIIHAVGDLITHPNTVYRFWRVSPWEVLIFFVGVFVTIFSSIENGIYCTIVISAAILLFRVLKAKGRFLGQVKIHSVHGDNILGDSDQYNQQDSDSPASNAATTDARSRNIFLPIDHDDGSNPEIEIKTPYPGVFIYRFSEGFNYPNANHYLDHLTNHIFAVTRRTNTTSYGKPGDRPWNDPGPRPGQEEADTSGKPTLKAIILDFSSVNNVDITSVQQLIDVRNQLDKYTSPEVVDWHFACINNRWTKRALVSAGFGNPSQPGVDFNHRWKPIFSVAEIGGADSAAEVAEGIEKDELQKQQTREASRPSSSPDGINASPSTTTTDGLVPQLKQNASRVAVVHGLNRPLFHTDLTGAFQSAVANIEARQEIEDRGGESIGALP